MITTQPLIDYSQDFNSIQRQQQLNDMANTLNNLERQNSLQIPQLQTPQVILPSNNQSQLNSEKQKTQECQNQLQMMEIENDGLQARVQKQEQDLLGAELCQTEKAELERTIALRENMVSALELDVRDAKSDLGVLFLGILILLVVITVSNLAWWRKTKKLKRTTHSVNEDFSNRETDPIKPSKSARKRKNDTE